MADPTVLTPQEQQLKDLVDQVQALQNILYSHKHQGFDHTQKLLTKELILMDGTTIDTNCSLASNFTVTLAGNRTLNNPRNPRDGQYLIYRFVQDATGSRTLTLDSKFVAGPWTVTLSTTAGKKDFLEVYYSATDDKFYILNFQKGY